MPRVRSGSGDKWARRAGAATTDYQSGVAEPRASWAAAATAGEGAYERGVQQGISRKAYGNGVRRSGDAKWQEKSRTIGADRYSGGVSAGKQDYESAVAPYLQTIASITLPPRGPKGDAANLQRVALIANALRAKKLQLSGQK